MSVAWSPDGGYLASSNTGGIVWIWDWAQGQQLPVTSMGEMSITNADGASDRKWIFSAEARYVRHEPNGKLLAQTDTSGMICLQIRWSPNRRLLLGRCNDDSSIFIWDAATGEALQRIYAELVTDIAWSPNGQQIASSSSNGTLRIWDVISGHQVNMLRNEAICEGVSLCGIESIAWSPDGSEIAFGDRDPKIKTWNLTSGHVEYIGEAAYSTPVHAVAWSPDGRRLASINGSGIQVWGLSDGLLSYVLDPGNLVEAYGVAWSPNGKYLAVAGRSRSVSPRGLIWIWSIP